MWKKNFDSGDGLGLMWFGPIEPLPPVDREDCLKTFCHYSGGS